MKKLFTALFITGTLLNVVCAFAQTGNFTTVNLTGTSGNILSASGSGRQVLSLSNDDITGVNSVKINDVGLGEGLVFTEDQIDISVAHPTDNGFGGLFFRTNAANPFFLHSSGKSIVNINSTSGAQGFYNSALNFSVNRGAGYRINHTNDQNNTGFRLNIVNSGTDKGLHVGREDTWIDKSLHIRANPPVGSLSVTQEMLFQTGGTGGTPPVLNARIFYATTSNERSGYFNLEKENNFGIHISGGDIHFGPPVALDNKYEKYNFPGSVKASRLLLGEFAGTAASNFTTDPSYLLAVDGKMIAHEVLCALRTRWPDYVFDKEYVLPSLEEVNEYVTKNKHLPGIPAAKDVEENGVNIGEMHAATLKKVEELTLYLIDMNERVKKLEDKNKGLKRQLNGSK